MGNTLGWAPNCRMSDSSSLLGTDRELNTDHAATTSPVRTATHVRSSRSLSLLGELQPLVVPEEAVNDSYFGVLRDPRRGQLVRAFGDLTGRLEHPGVNAARPWRLLVRFRV